MEQLTTFEEFSSIYTPQILFEVAIKRSPVLKHVDKLFREIKANPKDKTLWRQMEKKIQEFSGIKKVYFTVQASLFNAWVFPVYKDNLPSLFDEIERKPSKEQAEETAKYIKYAVINFGDLLIDEFSARELTGILLHELGHVYQHTANYSHLLGRKLFHYSRKLVSGAGLAMGVASLSNPAFLPLLLASFALSRSLTYHDHARELNADGYAAKYGYAEEIASAHLKDIRRIDKYKSKMSWMKRIWTHIKLFILPSTHPSDKDRVCNMIEKMKNEHKKTYPMLKNKFNVIYADLKC
jgi:Zn-dependent protease with chaperone function